MEKLAARLARLTCILGHVVCVSGACYSLARLARVSAHLRVNCSRSQIAARQDGRAFRASEADMLVHFTEHPGHEGRQEPKSREEQVA